MVGEVVVEFQRRSDRVASGLNTIPGIHCQVPQGAYYVFPNITVLGLLWRDLARKLLDEAGAAALSGMDFGRYGEGYLLMFYATSSGKIDLALERIKAVLG